jgi:hypothetical protein
LISGIGLIKKLNIGWITFNSIIWIGLTQFLLFSYHGIDTPLIIIAMGFFLILFILITRRLFHKLLKDYFKINKKRLILNYIYVIIVTGLYWVIDIYNYLIK